MVLLPAEAIIVTSDESRGDQRILTVRCLDYDAFEALPKAVEYDGKLFGLTGWNSDSYHAYYENNVCLAFPSTGAKFIEEHK